MCTRRFTLKKYLKSCSYDGKKSGRCCWCSSGNTCALVGIDQCLVKQGTISTSASEYIILDQWNIKNHHLSELQLMLKI